MSPKPPTQSSTADANPPSLTARAESHLAVTAQSVDRARRARLPRQRSPRTPPRDLQQAALREVFRQLGDTHRAYRARTGQGGSPELRAAARAFKRAPSVQSLVAVAAFLDELGLLAW